MSQNIVKVNESIRAYYRKIIQDVCDDVGMGHVNEFNRRFEEMQNCDEFVPRLLANINA